MPTPTHVPPVLIAADYSEPSGLALKQGFGMASALRTTPHVVYVALAHGNAFRIATPDEEKVLEAGEARALWAARVQRELDAYQKVYGPVTFDTAIGHLRVGVASEQIVQLATDIEAQLVVIGTHARGGLKRLVLGSVAEQVVRNAHCPVLVARAVQHDQQAPQIEPPCPDCVQARKASGGTELWCARHRERHVENHTYHHVPKNVRTRENFPLVIPMA